MTQYWVHKNRERNSAKLYPLILDVQSPHLKAMQSRVVIPLRSLDSLDGLHLARLNPLFQIDGIDYIAMTQQINTVQERALGEAVADFRSQSHIITAALDYLVSGV